MDRHTSAYQDYMTEAVDEALNEMMVYVEAAAKNTYFFRDNMQIPFISPVLAKARNQERLVEFTGEFIDSHSTQLTTSGPVHMFTFADKETAFLYDLFGLSEKKVLEFSNEMFKEAYGDGALFHIIREAPHKVLLTCVLIEAIQKKYTDVITCLS